MRGLHNGFKRGFALPTVLIASVILLTVLAVAVSATAAVRTTLKNQYYEQLAQTAGEAGVAYAKACLAENENIPQWTDEKPLTPATDCAGNNTLEPILQVLIVGGGGGGGSRHGGGGGGGGLIYNSSLDATPGTYPVVVGSGGSGTPNGSTPNSTVSTSGGNSSVFGLTAIGGGAGRGNGVGLAGGSGGGGGTNSAGGSGTSGQGYAGGLGLYSTYYMGGGGGGAGGAGTNASYPSATEPAGGAGVSNSITGATVVYAAGGKGASYNLNTVGVAGTANTGSGGGGAGGETNGGAVGGSGVVVISYLTDGGVGANVTGTVTTTTNGLYTVHTFTGNGNFNVTSAGASTCPTDPRCSVTVNDNVRSSFSIGLPTLDADGKAVKIPAGGYTEITRTSNGSVWRTYRQPSVQAAVVPDLCSGATSSTLGWQAVVLPSTDLEYAPTDQADVISISTSTIPFGSSFYRKDFSVTSAGAYDIGVQTAGSGAPDDAEIYVDGRFVARSDDQSLGTGSIALTAGCHNVVVRFINSHTVLANSAGRFAASVIQEGASIPTVVSDRTWRATAGDTVNFAHKDFYTGSNMWGLVRDIQTATSINSAWAGVSGENGARWISTTHSLSGANYPSAQYSFFRDSRTISVASPTDVRITYDCDDSCYIYLDGSIVANGTWNNVFSTNLTLSEGIHQLGAVVYNSSLGGSGVAIAVTRVSDGAVLTRTDASWLAGMRWQGGDTPMYSYDTSFNPVPNAEVIATVRALVVGGGGGGGNNHGGGGAGGGVRYDATKPVRVGDYAVVVGAGGAGGAGSAGAAGGVGGMSSFNDIISLGGGGGGGRINTNSVSQSVMGGSGGGGAGTIDAATGVAGAGAFGSLGQGNRGGNGSSGATAGNGGGGGGASVAGGNSSGTAGGAGTSGTGGNGSQYSITGSNVYYGGGGSGGRWAAGAVGAAGLGGGGLGGATDGAVGAAGTANTGGGGGGGGGGAANGGAGGSGVVVISYLTGTITATGGTITTSGGYTIHRFTTSGTFTVTSID